MKLKNKITIFSTFAEDKLINESGFVIRKQKGGPAFYLEQAFKKEKTSFILKSGSLMKTEILVKKNEEFGKVPNKPKPSTVKFSAIKTPCLVVSTILDEFDLKNLSDFKGKVFLDIQGYVRDGNNFGKKKKWCLGQETRESIFCLKGTKRELRNVSANFLKQQKKKVLLVTNGKRGCEVFVFGKRYMVRPKRVVRSNNTIGAGDTFFANFISQFVQNKKALASVKYAVDKTSEFLSLQNIHHHNQLF